MKVVINACYGGFGLSAVAVKRLAELKGRECYFFDAGARAARMHIPLTIKDATTKPYFIAFDIPNPSDVHVSSANWHEKTDKEKAEVNELYDAHHLDATSPCDRSDPHLVQVVEELRDKANGSCAKLKIVEIPDGVDWEISEYDGFEHVAEKHRTWG